MSPRIRKLLWGLFIVLVGVVAFLAYRKYVLHAPGPTLSWKRGDVTYELLSPRMLGAALLAPLFLFVMGRSLADLPWQQKIMTAVLRLAFVILVAFGLARLARTASTDKLCTVYVVDVSDSVSDESLGDARKTIQDEIAARRPDDIVKVITFARRPRLVQLDQAPKEVPLIERHDLPGAKTHLGAGSDLQAALQLAYGQYPPGYLKRAVLISDGVQTDGNVLAEVNRAKEYGVRLFTVPYRRPAPGEVAVRTLSLPDRVKVGETFEVHAEIYSSRDATAKAKLFQGEALNGLEPTKNLELKPGENDIVFKSVVRVPGEVTYNLELEGISLDRFPENNRYATTVDVPGRPAVLYVEGSAAHASYFANALTTQQFDVDIRSPGAFPGSLKELERYDFVVISDVPAEKVSLASQDLIERYVKTLGGGFLFAGGSAGYGLGGWRNTTIERLLPVRMDTEKRRDNPSLALALVIDRSGSMTGLPMEMAKAAAKATVDVLSPDDVVEVIAFDSSPTRFVKMQPARNRSRIENSIARIQAGGGTEIFSALDAAYQDMTVTQARKKHVILLTDGRAPTQGIRDLVQAMAAEMITVTSVGLGDEVDDQLLRMIADVGGGRYHKVTDPNALPKVFTRETEMVARQAAVEEWFPVTQVSPADFLRGLDINSAPLLHGYVSTKMKPAPAQLILQSDKAEPILARWRAGIGWAIAWTSDVKNQWAVEWLRWQGYGQFWGQLVHEHMRKKHRRELDMKTSVQGGEVHAVVDAFGADDRFENGLESTLTVTGPQPQGEKKTFPMRQTAPGRYEARFALEKYGSYLLRANHSRADEKGDPQNVAVSYGHISNPYPREYATFEPDMLTMERAAVVTGGKMDPSPAEVFDPASEKIVFHQDLWPKAIYAALAVFLLDLFLRRVRIFDRKFLPKRRRGEPLSGPISIRGIQLSRKSVAPPSSRGYR
ncbi:MAG: VWA domain-containing protein [Deltaproteobacteria bacterium]|nr:VWA domain-containing protein [Deltaproteobacteria bacterium]